MPVIFDEVVGEVEPERSPASAEEPPRPATPATPEAEREALRRQLGQVARRDARLAAD